MRVKARSLSCEIREMMSSGWKADRAMGEWKPLTFGRFERGDEVEDLVIFFRPAAGEMSFSKRVSPDTILMRLTPK